MVIGYFLLASRHLYHINLLFFLFFHRAIVNETRSIMLLLVKCIGCDDTHSTSGCCRRCLLRESLDEIWMLTATQYWHTRLLKHT